MTTLFVTQLDFKITEADLLERFKQYGNVAKVNVVRDKQTNRSRGFAFIEMLDAQQAQQAIQALNGTIWNGRACVVKEAEKKTNSPTSKSEPKTSNINLAPERKTTIENKPSTIKKKTTKDKPNDNTADGKNKKTKMNAYKKSKKNNLFIEEDDDADFDLFGRDVIEDIDEEDYKKYLLNQDDNDMDD